MEVPAYSPKLNMFHLQNIVSRNSTTSRYRVSYKINPFCTLHSRYIHVMNKWRGWLRWVFGHLFCVPDTDDIKQKNKKPWNRTKKISPEQKKKKSFWSRQHKNQRDGLTQLQSSLACSIPSSAPLFTAGTSWLWQDSNFATYVPSSTSSGKIISQS